MAKSKTTNFYTSFYKKVTHRTDLGELKKTQKL